MNLKNDLFFIAFISLLILNMLLIFSGVYSYFYNVNDYTLISGIIAFVGAIIGGSITLIGVKMTLNSAKEKEEIENLYNRKHALDETINQFYEARDMVYKNKMSGKSFDDSIGVLISSFVKINGITDSAVSSSRNAYDSVKKLEDCLENIRWGKNERYLHDDEKFKQLEWAFEVCNEKLKGEKRELLQRLLEKTSHEVNS